MTGTVESIAPPSAPQIWPLFGLVLETPRLRLETVTDAHLDGLAQLAAGGLHDPELQPFSNGWTDREGADFRHGFAQYFWSHRARWSPSSWVLPFAVFDDGELVAVQQLQADAFPVLKTVGTASWVGRRHQGRGIGTEMRAAVLELAFAHLDADAAVSGAYDYNAASLRVSEKLGYRRNGVRYDVVRDRRAKAVLFRLEPEEWARTHTVPTRIHGFDQCRELFGLAAAQPF